MSADDIAHIIQSILAPVVMVTACAITVGGLMTHYGAVNDRLRLLMHERLDLLRQARDADQIRLERLAEIDTQAPERDADPIRLERLAEIDTQAPERDADPIRLERLAEIDTQAPELVRRHRLVRDAILAIYGAMVALVACMFAIAWAAVSGSTLAAAAVLVLFLLGMLALLVGLFISALEIRTSHRALDYEINQVLNLPQSGPIHGRDR